MAINLLSIEPTKLSTDLSSYIVYLYGDFKVGKTSFCRDAKALILAAERGYNALANAYVQDVTKWSDVRAILRELRKPEVKEKFKMVAFDTIDIFGDLCTKYVCQLLGIDNLGDTDWGKGWTAFKKEFSSVINEIIMLGYGVIFVSHAKTIEKDISINGKTEKRKVITRSPSASVDNIIAANADVTAYAYIDPETKERKLRIRDDSETTSVGSRFRYIASEIPFSYDDLVKAINDAIKKEESVIGKEFITDKKNEIKVDDTHLDYTVLMQKGTEVVKQILDLNPNAISDVTNITERTLGAGKKFTQCTYSQVEAMNLVLTDLTDFLEELKKKSSTIDVTGKK